MSPVTRTGSPELEAAWILCRDAASLKFNLLHECACSVRPVETGFLLLLFMTFFKRPRYLCDWCQMTWYNWYQCLSLLACWMMMVMWCFWAGSSSARRCFVCIVKYSYAAQLNDFSCFDNLSNLIFVCSKLRPARGLQPTGWLSTAHAQCRFLASYHLYIISCSFYL